MNDLAEKIAGLGAHILADVIPGGGTIVNVLKKTFGADDEKTLIDAIESDPDAAVKLMEIESRHEIALVQASVERERISLEDRDSARGIERKPLYRPQGAVIRHFLRCPISSPLALSPLSRPHSLSICHKTLNAPTSLAHFPPALAWCYPTSLAAREETSASSLVERKKKAG